MEDLKFVIFGAWFVNWVGVGNLEYISLYIMLGPM